MLPAQGLPSLSRTSYLIYLFIRAKKLACSCSCHNKHFHNQSIHNKIYLFLVFSTSFLFWNCMLSKKTTHWVYLIDFYLQIFFLYLQKIHFVLRLCVLTSAQSCCFLLFGNNGTIEYLRFLII